MADLLSFLTERLNEDEAAAKAWLLLPANWSVRDLLQPERRLAEVEAKRRIVAEYIDPRWKYDTDYRDGLETALRELASVYQDHPDFDHDWRPTP